MIDSSRGGQTIKIHMLVDVMGRQAVLLLTPGNASDIRITRDVLAEAPGWICCLIADESYDTDPLRKDLGSAQHHGHQSLRPVAQTQDQARQIASL